MATRLFGKTYKKERRKARRAQPSQPIEGVDLTSGETVRLRDFSTRSFAVEASDPLTGRKAREFEFPMGRGRIAFKGVARRRARVGPARARRYLVAFEFTYGSATGKLAVDYFVRSLRGQVA
jgi:hypothetical protein